MLKGPQGVLYGRNASAGTVNLLPRRPVHGENTGYASGSFGSYDTFSAEAAINLALGKNGALRVSGILNDQDSFLDGYPEGASQQGLRFQLGADLTPDIALRVASDYTHLGGIGLGSSYVGNYVFNPATGAYRFISSGLPLSKGIYSDEGRHSGKQFLSTQSDAGSTRSIHSPRRIRIFTVPTQNLLPILALRR